LTALFLWIRAIIEQASPEEFFEQPKTERAKAF
jgi:ABC-type histidine transport system ATPase subunit